MLETAPASAEALVRQLDTLIRARYPLISVTMFEEARFRRLMEAVVHLDKHRSKGLFVWSRTQGLRQIAGPNQGPADRAIPGTEDPVSILEHIGQAERGLFVLCDYGAYLAPDGLPDPILVRQLRELAWAVKTRAVTVLFPGSTFPEIPALEKEIKVIELPLPDGREVERILDLRLQQLRESPDARVDVDEQTREQLAQALLELTETEIDNALAKAAIGSAAMSIRRALSIATTLKGILGVSEFEKGVGGLQSSAHSDGGETARTIGFLLNWMQEQNDVFVFATANDVRQLAPEQIRQGRFGQVVFVDLPTLADRAAIFRVHLSKRGRDPDAFDIDAVAATAGGFSGAEIEAAVKSAVLDAFIDGSRGVTTADIERRVRSIRPTPK